MSNFTERLTTIFLEKSGIKESFDQAYDIFVEMAENNEPLPKIAQAVSPHLRPVVQQFTGVWGRTKLQALSVAVNWKLSNISEEEIIDFLGKAKAKASADTSKQSKDVMDVAQKFLDGLSPERIQQAVDANKGAVTADMIEDVIALVNAVKSVLPAKLDGYLHDVIPEIDDLENIIRKQAGEFVSSDTGAQLETALSAAKTRASQTPDQQMISNGQNGLMQKLDDLKPDAIKRIIDSVGEDMTRKKIYNLTSVFFKFADEVLESFEDSSKPLRDCEFKHGAAYQSAISEFLQFVEDALDAEGVLPERIDTVRLKTAVQSVAGQTARAPSGVKPPRP